MPAVFASRNARKTFASFRCESDFPREAALTCHSPGCPEPFWSRFFSPGSELLIRNCKVLESKD